MALRAVLDNLDNVPEALHAEYVEKDGKFQLDLEGVEVHPSVLALKSAHDRTKAANVTLKSENTTLRARTKDLPDDFDPAEYQALKDRLEELEKDPANRGKLSDEEKQRMRDQYETRIRNLEQKHAGEIAALNKKVEDSDGELGGILVGDGLTSALVEAGVDKRFLPATRALLRPSVKVVRDEDTGRRRAVVETDLGDEISVKDFVQNWAKSDDGKAYVIPASGGGAGGSDRRVLADNPFSREHWNVTAQGNVLREKGQEHAERLARAAGTTLGGPQPPARRVA